MKDQVGQVAADSLPAMSTMNNNTAAPSVSTPTGAAAERTSMNGPAVSEGGVAA